MGEFDIYGGFDIMKTDLIQHLIDTEVLKLRNTKVIELNVDENHPDFQLTEDEIKNCEYVANRKNQNDN